MKAKPGGLERKHGRLRRQLAGLHVKHSELKAKQGLPKLQLAGLRLLLAVPQGKHGGLKVAQGPLLSPSLYLPAMKTWRLLGVLCWLAGPLRAQPQLALRTDTTAAAPVRVPIPEAVWQACRHYLPELAADQAATWTAYYGYSFFAPLSLHFHASIRRDLPYRDEEDSTGYHARSYELWATFDSAGQVLEYARVATVDTLPSLVRRTIRRWQRRDYFTGSVAVVIAAIDPYEQRRSRRRRYIVWLRDAPDGYPEWYELRSNGRLIPNPRFR